MKLPNRVIIRTVFLVPFFLALLWLRVFGQSAANQPPSPLDTAKPATTGSPTPIRVAANLVLVPVSVTGPNRKPLGDLKISDFRITEDGKPQVIANLHEPGQSPVDLALLIDISGSVSPRFNFEQQAGSEFLRSVIGPERFVTVFTIGPQPRRVSERTNSPTAAVRALMSLSPTRDATAFYDSLASAAQYLGGLPSSPFSRRVQVVLSDGEDNYSLQNGLESVLRELQESDCLFYSINPAKPSIEINQVSRRGEQNLQLLAAQTGGAAFLPDNWSELPSIYRQIAADLQAQYLLGYYSSERSSGEGYRRISVTVPARPDVRVRARQGYFPRSQNG